MKNEPKSYRDAKKNLKAAVSRINGRLLLKTIAIFLIVFAIYAILNALRFEFHWILYLALGAALAVVYFVLNGFTFSSSPITREMLSDKIPEDEKDAFLERLEKRRKIAKRLLPYLFAILATVFFDYLYLTFFDSATGLFSSESGGLF